MQKNIFIYNKPQIKNSNATADEANHSLVAISIITTQSGEGKGHGGRKDNMTENGEGGGGAQETGRCEMF